MPADNYKDAIIEKPRLFDFIVAPAILFLILLIGHYGLFFGDTFFAEEDPVTVSGYHSKNIQVGGWRSDLGLGMSYFFADPGSMHTWSPFRWWHQLFSDDHLAYSISVFILMWAACVAQFFLLRTAVPNLSKTVAVLLSAIIAFSSLRYEVFFIRSSAMMPIAAVLVALLLRQFYERPLFRHYFWYTAILFLTLFLGSAACLLQTIFFSAAFFLALLSYQFCQKKTEGLPRFTRNFIYLNGASGLSLFILGGWVFYSVFLEHQMVGYTRDPDYSPGAFFASPNLLFILNRISTLIHAGLISHSSGILGINQTIVLTSWNNVSALFPIFLLVAIFFKSRNFWEFSAKFLVLGFLLYIEICAWVPGVLDLIQSLFNLYPPSKMHPFMLVFEILMLGFLIERLGAKGESISSKALKISRSAVFVLSALYAAILMFVSLAVAAPKSLDGMLQVLLSGLTPFIESEAKATFLTGLISENVRLFNETMGLSYLMFYGTTLAFLLLLGTKRWPQFVSKDKGRLFALALLVNAIFLSWAVYPLNKEPLVWDKQNINGVPLAQTFKLTDRITRIYGQKCRGRLDYIDCIEKKFFTRESGPRRYLVGYTEIPIMEFSSPKPFSQRDVAEFIDTFLGIENIPLKGVRRHLQTSSSISSSRLYDISAVNFILSTDPVSDENGLELIYKGTQFYLYKNLRAWPYYYFAERVETIESFKDLYEGIKGVGYIWDGDVGIEIPPELHDDESQLRLEKFIPGEMEFQYSSKASEFLVIADSWHPNWHVQVDDNDTQLTKANGVFKGVLLPPGSHRVRLFFDSSRYMPGVWISIVGWAVFFSGWGWVVLNGRNHSSLVGSSEG